MKKFVNTCIAEIVTFETLEKREDKHVQVIKYHLSDDDGMEAISAIAFIDGKKVAYESDACGHHLYVNNVQQESEELFERLQNRAKRILERKENGYNIVELYPGEWCYTLLIDRK